MEATRSAIAHAKETGSGVRAAKFVTAVAGGCFEQRHIWNP